MTITIPTGATVFTLAGAFAAGPSYLNQALGGTITNGNTVVPINYPNWTFFEAQVDTGAQMLNDAITTTSGMKIAFGHSLGAVVISNWLKNYGPTCTVPGNELMFVLIGNSVRKYGGELNASGLGFFFPNSYPIPSGTPYTVYDFTRQYDGFADIPQFSGNTSQNLWAFLNAISGEGNVHPYYNDVTLDDAANVWHTEGNINWGWSPTWPLPIFGTSQNFGTQAEDEDLRATVEASYSRPVSVGILYSGAPYLQKVTPTGIPSGAAFGTTTVAKGPQIVLPDGIPTDDLFGEMQIWHVGTITPRGIPSGEKFGNLSIPSLAEVFPTPMASDVQVGTPTVAHV